MLGLGIILGAIVLAFVVSLVHTQRRDGYLVGDDVFGAVLGAVLAGFFTLLALLVISGVSSPSTTETSTELRNLNTGSETSGSFFLGSGYVDEERVLNYIERDSDGGNRVYSVEADKAVIYEDTDSPRLVTVAAAHGEWLWGAGNAPFIERTYKFYVPEGSVFEDYTIK